MLVQLVDNPVEIVTAITNLVMGGVGALCWYFIFRVSTDAKWQQRLWLIIFSLLTLASVLGAVHHGIAVSATLYDLSWSAIFLLLGTLIGLFVVASCHDLWGVRVARKVLPVMMVMAVVFIAVSWARGQDFRLFILYQALALLFAQVGYLYLVTRRVSGSLMVSAGIMLTIIAAIVQAARIVTLVPAYPFDHNAAYHVIQIPGIVFLTIGIRRMLVETYRRKREPNEIT
ncbi:MAG: hypothetical protein WD558_09005 [Pseudomonadales bacterium]